jgi:hypothetical protein
MRELVTSLVFEVDHPDSQQQKLQRVASLTQEAREVRFVPVDFRRGDLAYALEALNSLVVGKRKVRTSGDRVGFTFRQRGYTPT